VAQSAGFAQVVDLTDAYDGLDPATLAIGPNDFHPNAGGHARLARQLALALDRRPELERLWTAARGPNQGKGAASP
jgi:hypothetical protein